MVSTEIINDWKVRCLQQGIAISNLFRAAKVSPSVASQWGRSNAACPEASVVKNLTAVGVHFNVVANAVEAVPDEFWPSRNRIFNTYIKVERTLREMEARQRRERLNAEAQED